MADRGVLLRRAVFGSWGGQWIAWSDDTKYDDTDPGGPYGTNSYAFPALPGTQVQETRMSYQYELASHLESTMREIDRTDENLAFHRILENKIGQWAPTEEDIEAAYLEEKQREEKGSPLR